MIVLLFLLVYLFKIHLLGNLLTTSISNSHILIATNDSYIIILAITLYKLSSISIKTIAKISLLLLNINFILYLSDFISIAYLNQRLHIEDVVKYGLDIDQVIGLESVLIAVPVLILMIVSNKNNISLSGKNQILLIGIFGLLITYSKITLTNNSSSPRVIYTKNLIQINTNRYFNSKYSKEFIYNFNFEPQLLCEKHSLTKPENIYVFFVESWSNYHSKYYGGDNNWTPKLDALAKENISYHNFYANGYTTEFALLSTIYSQPAIPYRQDIGLTGQVELESFKINNHYLNAIHRSGYDSFFVTSGNLGFQQKGSWLSSVGFNHILGADSFVEKRRFTFNSVEDRLLFNKVIELSEENQTKRKIFFIENVTTHAPYLVPTNNETMYSEEAAFRYLDEHLSSTINTLDNGRNLIIVLSDHRAMSPLKDYELRNSGTMASSHTPAFMIWQGLDIEYHSNFQQSDILRSISGLVSGKNCSSNIAGALFPAESPKPAKCVLFLRGDNRNLVSAKCGQDTLDILLDGDDTRILNPSDSKRWDFLIDEINYLRLNQGSIIN